MAFYCITVMTVAAVSLFTWLAASSQRTNLYSLRNLFMAVWLYYGFAVGIDLLTGAEIPFTHGEIHLMDPSNWGGVAFVMWNYVLCGLAFVITYVVAEGNRPILPVDVDYRLRIPPKWAILGLNLATAVLYGSTFFGMGRMERIAVSQLSVVYKLVILSVPLTLAVNLVVILSAKGSRALLAWTLAMILSLLTGNRNYVMFVILVGAFHWRPEVRGWKLIGMVSSAAGMVFAFKTLYSVALAWWMGNRVDMGMISENLKFTLCGLDADASYIIATFFTGQPSPLWMGRSYIETPILLAWPRFLGGVNVSTLAEDYIWNYHPATASRGGAMAFSAIAEAWLNFSYFGAVLLGIFWGLVTSWFDRRPRGMAFFIVMLMVARIFRSDAASLFKNWVLIWGVLFAVALGAMALYTSMMEPTRKPLRGQVANRRPQKPTRGRFVT